MAFLTYYFDGSDAAASDPDSNWSDDSDAFDGSLSTSAIPSSTGSSASNYLKAEGTNAPSSGDSITAVRARIYVTGIAVTCSARIYTDGESETLQTIDGDTGWGDYEALSTPSGGWTWAKIQALEVKIWLAGSISSPKAHKVEIEVETELNYYFDGSDAAASVTSGSWDNITNVDDGDRSSKTDNPTNGSIFTIEGTNAPSSGDTITQVRASMYGGAGGVSGVSIDIFTDGQAENLGTVDDDINTGTDDSYFNDYTTLSTPTGGWTWAKIQALEVEATASVITGGPEVYFISLEVTTESATTTSTSMSTSTSSTSTSTTQSTSTSTSTSTIPPEATYTYEDVSALPTDDTDLNNAFTNQNYSDVRVDDDEFFCHEGDEYITNLYKWEHINNEDFITITVRLKSALAPSTSTIYLQIYNHDTTTWETIDSDSATAADTEFELTDTITAGVADYYGVSNVVVARTYQQVV